MTEGLKEAEVCFGSWFPLYEGERTVTVDRTVYVEDVHMEENQQAGTRGQASPSKATPRDLLPPGMPHFSTALQPHKTVP